MDSKLTLLLFSSFNSSRFGYFCEINHICFDFLSGSRGASNLWERLVLCLVDKKVRDKKKKKKKNQEVES